MELAHPSETFLLNHQTTQRGNPRTYDYLSVWYSNTNVACISCFLLNAFRTRFNLAEYTLVILEVYEKTSGILILGGTIISSVNHKPRQTAITTVNVPFFYQHFNFFLLLTPSRIVISNTPTDLPRTAPLTATNRAWETSFPKITFLQYVEILVQWENML
jgi:hypothetical protein